MIICAGRTESFSFAKAIGVGLVESAYNLCTILKEEKPKTLLFVGSCGSYGGLTVMESFYSSSATNIEQAEVFGSGYTPLSNKIYKNVSHETIVNSSSYITADKNVSDGFLRLGLGAENMEFYSVLWAATKAGVDATGFFVVTNYCYPGAGDEYRKNLQAATEIIYDRYEKELKEYE